MLSREDKSSQLTFFLMRADCALESAKPEETLEGRKKKINSYLRAYRSQVTIAKKMAECLRAYGFIQAYRIGNAHCVFPDPICKHSRPQSFDRAMIVFGAKLR